MSHHQPLGFKPAFYWDETAGLKEAKPMLVKLVQSANQRGNMPGKCPSAFGVTVGYTIPFQSGSHYVLWRVIPAGVEFRQNHLIFTPAPKGSPLKAVLPEEAEAMPEAKEIERPKQKPNEAEEKEVLPEKSEPSFVVKYVPLPLTGSSPPATPVGVTFVTQRENHRLVWNVLPGGEALSKGLLILDPWENPEEEITPSKSHWWQRK